ncbi:uncharacterized protein F4822DRAFT_408858, partial [Hypoxylon trugodes]|uniref:uncharacterized protein n=1 Tax=Hypoxylon trugodes TaxID=326681 RepID=UPI002190A958
MKNTISTLLALFNTVLVLAAPTPATPSEANTPAPASWRLDCGSPGTTAMCSASNSGAHCDPVSGDLTIILAGTCSACRCLSVDQCSRGCGKED